MKNISVSHIKKIAPSIPKRGRPRIRGTAVKLSDLFEQKDIFVSAEVTMYGKLLKVESYCVNLLWGLKLYQKLRFVLVKYSNSKAIFVNTDLSMDPVMILEAYAHRFKIECMFRELKQQLCAFGYHFQTKRSPQLNKYKKRSDPDSLQNITDKKEREAILATVEACE